MNPQPLRQMVRQPMFLILGIVALVTIVVPVLRVSSASKKTGAEITVRAAGRGFPHISLQDGRDLQTEYDGDSVASRELGTGKEKPLALATGDFDSDGVSDLIVAYSTSTGGLIVMHRGSAPVSSNTTSSKSFASPFHSPAFAFATPGKPDFLGVGDFNRDGFLDAILATRDGSELYLMSGDGAGRLSAPIAIGLPGRVTAMIVGDLNHRDGLADVAVAVNNKSGGPSVLVFDSPETPFLSEPAKYAVLAEVTSLSVEQRVEDAYTDLVAASGGDLVLIHGRTGLTDTGAAVEKVDLPFRVRAVASGDFVSDRDHRPEIAALADDGRVHMLSRGELARSSTGQGQAGSSQSGWTEVDSVEVARPASVGTAARRVASQALLTVARLSDQPTDDLLVLIPNEKQIHVIIDNPSSSSLQLAATFDVEGLPLATLPIPTSSGKNGLAVLRKGQTATSILLPAPSPFKTQAVTASFTNSAVITIPAAPTASPAAASPYPSIINVPASVVGSISSVSLTLNNFHHAGQKDVDAVLIGPTGASLVFMSDMGGAGSPSIFNLTFDDSAAGIAPNTVISAAGTFRPTNYDNPIGVGDSFPGATPAGPYNNPAPTGSATLTSIFATTSPIGDWKLYIFDDAGGEGGACDGGWTLNITTAVAASATTTTIVSSLNPSLTTNPVTFTAHVVKNSDSSNVTVGTVTFSDTTLGTTLAANVALNGSGQAQYLAPANSLTERSHVITATYNPDPSFFGSNGSLSQTVDFPTTNPSTGMYCNTNSLAAPGSGGGSGVPYPSHISVSGLGGSISRLVVTLKNVSHVNPGDLDILLVSPDSTRKMILVSDAGENSTNNNVTVNFDDLAGSSLGASMTPWGAPGSTVSSKPVNYGSGDTFPSPAPSGPYGDPAPQGSSTLASVFNGANPNGTWSLYVLDDSGFDVNAVSGGWCLTFTTTGDAVSTTTITSSVNPSFTTAPNNSTTFTATVTSGANPVTVGSVSFVDNSTGATICGNIPLDGTGHATCPTSFATEGDRVIMANYSGAPGQFNTSSGSLTQQVDSHTTVSGNQFCNPGAISIPNSANATGGGIARPYPSRIFVTGLGSICSLTVTLNNLSHADPDDMDLLLVGPNGQNIILMSDTGGAADVSGLNLTFSDAAGSSLPDGSPLVSGTFKPTNFEVIDSFPSPAPTPGSNTTLAAAFAGSNPNGTWSLYVVDDALGGIGQIAGGWCLTFTTVSCAITGPDPVCAASIGNTYNGPTGANLTYSWSISGNGSIVGSTTGQSVSVTAGAIGSYNVMLTVTDTALACSSSCSKSVTVNGCADISISKSAPATVNAGSNLTYTLNFSNAGPSTATNVTVSDAVPAGTTFVSAMVTSGTGWSTNTAGPIVFSKASVPNGETATFQIVVNVPAATADGATIHNSATASSSTNDPNPANTATADTTVIAQADLALTKSALPTPDVIAGNQITYTIGLTNNGPAAASSVTVSDPTPANTTLVSVTTPGGWSRTDVVPSGGTGTITFTKTTVANAETASFTIVVKVNSSTANNTTITNTASVDATTNDPGSGNDSAMTMTNAIRRINLSVTKGDAPDPVIAGNNITYTINFNNAGPSDASTVTVTDAVPANTSFVSATVTTGTGWSTNTSGPIVFSKAAVATGESAVFTIVVKVNSNTADAATITNSVTAAATETDTDGSNNTANATTGVITRADLVVLKSDAPDPVTAGGNLTYTINFSNAGPSDAQTVTVSDAVPPGTAFVSAMVTSGTGWAVNPAGPIVFSKATVVAGETAVFTIVVSVPASTANGATIVNSAIASSATTDSTPGNNTGMSTTTVQTRADLAVTKGDSPDPSFAGANITYTIGLTNNGLSDAQTVSVTDATPINTTFVSATFPAGWSRTDSVAVGGTGTITFTKTTVAAGETASFTIVVKIDATTTAGTNISNTASATSATTDPNPENGSATATTNVQTQADLAVTKTALPTPNVVAGTNVVYTINLINNGPGSATSVTVTDPTPANTTFVSASFPVGWSRTDSVAVGGTGSVIFSKAAVANAEVASFIIVVKVNSSAATNSTITNTATAASATGDPDDGNNAGVAMSNVQRRIDLSVGKADGPDPVIAGNQITYTIGFNNSIGPSDASNVVVTDAVPGGTTLVSATVTTGTGWSVNTSGPVTFSKAAVTVGETAVFTIVVSVPSSTANGVTINNSATAEAAEIDLDTNNNTTNATTSVITRADLVVIKTDSPDPVNAGTNLTYTINFSNAGPSDAQTVTVSDAVPVGTSLVSATVTTGVGWTVNPTGPIVFSKGTVIAGESAVFTIVVSVPASTPNGATINNSAIASSATTDAIPGNNTGMSATTVQTRADLAVTKSDTPDPVNAGSDITYTINFVNNGPSDAQTVTVTDSVPANTTFVSAVVTTGTGWAVNTAGPIVFSKSTVAVGETAVFTLVVKVNSNTSSGATITNNATAASATTDQTPGNNTGTTTTTVQVMADLAITKSDSPDPVIAGNNLTYTINLTNNGPSDANTVSVSDAVPAGTSFVSATVTTGTGWSVNTAGPIVFSKAMVVNGEAAVFTIVVKVNANVANGATITNTATVTAASSDGTSGNNSATATTTVQTSADLVVTKSDSPDPVIAGNNLTYTINFVNNGPSDAQTVTVTDAVPPGTSFVSAMVTTGSGWSVDTSGPIVFSKATVAATEAAVFTIVVNINANVPNGSTISNSATAATATTDPTPGNNTGAASTTVQTRADLAVTKTDSPDPVFAGNNLTYAINFVNNGPSDAQTVTVTDAVPANTTFVSATVTTGSGWSPNSPGVGGTGNVVFSKGTVGASEAAVFTVVVKVNSNTASGATISNSAVAATATTDLTPGNNTGMATTTVQTQADLAVVKTDSPDPVVVSQNLTYTINFANNGPSDAQTVTVTDPMPPNTTFVSAAVTTGSGWTLSSPPANGTGTITFSKASVPAGQTAVFTIVLKVDLNTPNNTTLTNTATAASTTSDGTSGNNSSTTTTLVLAQADLAVTKTDTPDPACVDGNIVYTINFVNNGPGPGLSTTVTDAVPANTTLVSAVVTTGSGWSINTAGPIVFSKASVGIGESAVFQIVVKINSGTIHGTVITNQATAASTIPDPTPENNTGTATTTVDPIPPTITCPANITVSTDPNQCSAVVTYAAPTVTDNCPCSTTAGKKGKLGQAFCLPVCDPPSGSTFPKGTTTVTCSATDAAGNQSSCSFTVTVNDTQPPIITCPANITTKTQPGNPCAVVNYPNPLAGDNCPGVTVVCNPPSGSCFPLGSTTVTCTATDGSGNTATCTFKVAVFDLCVQDDSNPSTVVLINSLTGDYRFCCNGVTYTGRGTMSIRGSLYTLEHNPSDKRVLVKVDEGVHKGQGSISAPPGTIRCTITDRNTQDNSCACQ